MAAPILKLFGVGKDLVTSQMSQERGTQSLNTTLSDGQLLEGVALVNGDTAVKHSLGRTPSGFLVVAKDVDRSVWGSTFGGQKITVSADGACTVSLWVF